MDWDSSSYSSSASDSASSESTARVTTGTSIVEPNDDDATDFPFDFATDVKDQADGSESDDDADDGDGFDSAAGSLSSTKTPINQQLSSALPTFQVEFAATNITSQSNMIPAQNVTTREESTNLSEEVSSTSTASAEALSIMHRGSLRRIINPSAVHDHHHAHSPSRHYDLQKVETSSTSWPMYSITVALPNQNLSPFASQQQHVDQYQIIFNRQQYEFCTRIFALLDTDCQSCIGPECIRNFLYLHCPVVRRRDGAIACQVSKDGCLSSPTVDEIWNTVIGCDPKCKTTAAATNTRIGIEGWMILCRLLALVYEQESQRRFASRHLQQMMRHKHGGGGMGRSGIINPNEVVVVVDNPPPGPPAQISIEALMRVERERGLSSSCDCIQGWPFCPLPLPELDLDHWLLPTVRDTALSTLCQSRGRISVEPFSTSTEGGFILRFERKGDSSKQSIVARRSYADFEWLNQILISHKRPGHGHLCGRILPPFPTKRALFVPSTSGSQGLQKEVGEKAITAAISGVGMLTSVAKSLWGSYVSGAGPSSTNPENQLQSGTPSAAGDDIPVEVAHAIERYLNYLSENEAFATSFPLNAILQGSQTGLESAKQVLQEHFKLHKKEKKMKQHTVSPEGKLSSAYTIYNALVRKRASSFAVYQDDDDTPWLRAAAQVALALQFHGILETTGYESTSARIQHASLPKFNNAKNSWDEEDNVDTTNNSGSRTKEVASSPRNEACFETGVVRIESELNNEEDMGYDLLPFPGLSDEQSVLNAGTSVLNTGGTCTIEGTRQFIYRMAADKDVGDKLSTIGTMNVETDIDKVREVIKSVDHTIGKLHDASLNVQKAQLQRNAFKTSLLRDIDSWCGSGDVISQRALVSGVAEISTANGNSESSYKYLSNGECVYKICLVNIVENPLTFFCITLDISWQSSLATSALSGAAEVRDALKASRTATRAKTAAFAAAEKAKDAYESCDNSSSKEEIQSYQTNAFATQSHAIHAAVVEYEANLSLKRASTSLAHDVKCWNVHRKKELLRTCIQFAKSQKEACKKASDAWVSLRDGLIDSEYTPLTTVGFDAFVNPGISTTQSEPSTVLSDQYDWNLAESGDSDIVGGLQNTTARVANSSVVSVPSSHSGLPVSKESLSSAREEEISQGGDIYDVTSSDLDVDCDYFAYRQDNVHDYPSEACGDSMDKSDSVQSKNEDFQQSSHANQSQIISDEVQESNDNRSESARSMSSSTSTSMQSLIDDLMAWGEDDDRPDDT
jgi:hypothetical protein